MIIDCFPFFDELDLLEIRLNELKDVVDMFVLTESTKTFTGIHKPLYFKENKDRFKEFNIVNTTYFPREKYLPTVFEKHQKQYNLTYVFDNIFTPGDVVIQGDVDEIPKASVVKEIIKDKDWKSVRLRMPLFYYYLNCRELPTKRIWKNSRLLRPTGWFEYNAKQDDKTDKIIWNSGWHFSFLGNVQKKLEAWGHANEYNKPPYNTPEHIKKCMEQGLDLVMRTGKRKIDFEFVDDLNYLPQYVLDNLDRFSKYIK